MSRRRASGPGVLWRAAAHLVSNHQDTPIVKWWNGDGNRVMQKRAQSCRRALTSGKFLDQVAFLRHHHAATGVGEWAAVFQQRRQRRDSPRCHEFIAAPLAGCRVSSSARPCTGRTLSRPSVATTSCWKRTFLPVASSEVTRQWGNAIASGNAGKPAPLPISSTRRDGRAHVQGRQYAGERIQEVTSLDLRRIGDGRQVDARVPVQQ